MARAVETYRWFKRDRARQVTPDHPSWPEAWAKVRVAKWGQREEGIKSPGRAGQKRKKV